MLVEQLMARPVETCRASDTLAHAAQLMWDHDCGCLPVCDDSERVIGVITDRDICMCGLFERRPLEELSVATAMSKDVHVCRADDTIEHAEELMRDERIRRLPVVDDGRTLVGLIALADLAREAADESRGDKHDVTESEVGFTLAAICAPLPHQIVAPSMLHANVPTDAARPLRA
jgi:CBS-domain-containing membrane protein